MAHADSHCCAVCDRKMAYGGAGARTKEEICKDCRRSLREAGIRAADVEALVSWMKEHPNARSCLDEIGFKRCFYANPVDDAYGSMSTEDVSTT